MKTTHFLLYVLMFALVFTTFAAFGRSHSASRAGKTAEATFYVS